MLHTEEGLRVVGAGIATAAREELLASTLLDDAAFCQKGECNWLGY